MEKKKYAFLIIYLILFYSCAFGISEAAFNTPESWTRTLNGNIQKIREYTGQSIDSLILKRAILFNENNYPVSETSYDGEGEKKGEIQYLYSNNGPVREIRGMNAGDQLNWKYTYSYDEDLKLLEEISRNAKNEIEWKDTYRYNENGLLSEKINYNADGSPNLQDTFQYDDQGILLTRTTLYSDGKLLKRVTYSYTPEGKVDREEHYDSNGLYETVRYSYEANRMITASTLSPEGSVKEERAYKHNSEGRLSREELSLPGQDPVTDLIFVYDDRGNWVRRWETPGTYTIREIEYTEE